MIPSSLSDRADQGRTETAIDPDRPCYLDGQVVLRPATCGGLAYHFGTMRAVVFKPHELSEFLAGVEQYPTLRAALDAAGLTSKERPIWEESLARLAGARVIRFR